MKLSEKYFHNVTTSPLLFYHYLYSPTAREKRFVTGCSSSSHFPEVPAAMVLTSFAFVFFTSFCIAAPSPYTYSGLHRRQDAASDNTSTLVVLNNTVGITPITVGVSNTTVAVNGTNSTLVPVLPPTTDQTSFSVLALDTQVTLAWAGGSQSSTGNLVKRAGSVYSQANLTFAYPVIPLDHSNYVSGVTCSGNQLSGTLSSAAYSFAKQQWAGAPDIVFVTSADGCGADAANDYFHAKAVTFTDNSLSFAADGSSAMLKVRRLVSV